METEEKRINPPSILMQLEKKKYNKSIPNIEYRKNENVKYLIPVISSPNFFIQVVLLIPKALDFLCWVLESLLERGTLLEKRKIGKGPYFVGGEERRSLVGFFTMSSCHKSLLFSTLSF